jgi:hypothetical protein
MSSRRGDYVVFSREALIFLGGALLMLPVNLGIAATGCGSALVSPAGGLASTWLDLNSAPGTIASLWCPVMGVVVMYFAIRRFNARND